MEHDPHTGFIVAAYVIAAVMVVSMIVVIVTDYVGLRRSLLALWRARPRSRVSDVEDEGEQQTAATRRAWLVYLPGVLFALVAGLFLLRLYAGDASRLPSALLGKPVPAFTLAPVEGLAKPGLSAADLKAGKVTVVNVFASWCGPCRDEAPALLRLSQKGLPLVGIAYKDKPENTRRFLTDDGDPFKAVGADVSGLTGIDFGVYGVPETYVVNGRGIITAKIVGPLTDEAIQKELLPAVARAESAR